MPNLLLNSNQCRIDAGVAELFLGVFRIFASFERPDANPIHHPPALLALGQPAVNAEHGEPGSLLFRVFAA